MLGYFKYTTFLLTTVNDIFQAGIPVVNIVLPIGISFYTFQQIAYLSDIYTKKNESREGGFFEYATFICFFPQLIAGPIVHHSEVVPQFADARSRTVQWENIYLGLYYLTIGLAKKVLIADSLAPLVKFSFEISGSLSFVEAFLGCMAYTLQLYFDFSGYADMAIGCALFFNIKLPYNFNSPYKALSIQDFWRRWHMTLSRWLRDYLYIPLGGNKKGEIRTMGNIFITFLLGGIWHGAGWTFVLWGMLHGCALVLHRIWSQVLNYKMPRVCAWICTFLFVSLAWIPFRAENFRRVEIFVDGFLGYNGFFIRESFSNSAQKAWSDVFYISGGVVEYSFVMFFTFVGILFLKNSQESAVYLKKLSMRVYLTLLLACSLTFLLLPGYSPEFIYFKF